MDDNFGFVASLFLVAFLSFGASLLVFEAMSSASCRTHCEPYAMNNAVSKEKNVCVCMSVTE